MEKAMSVEERIRRAENIYNKRNGIKYSNPATSDNNRRKNIKKLFIQIFMCLSIYVIFYTVSNRDHIFSEEFRGEVSIFFTEKTKIYEWLTNVKEFMASKFTGNSETENNSENSIKGENSQENNTNIENKSTEQNDNDKKNKTDENIGGALENKETKENKETTENKGIVITKKETSEFDKMKKTAEEIKSKIGFIAPIKGRISSTFGWRNPTSVTVPRYHTGIDIAAKEGTIIKSATNGKVIMTSSQGDYGNHYQIQTQDIIIVYAHCKKLYLKEGDMVKQGQEIAEVGSTGNSTGPHLHFEIRKGEQKIDPQLIIDF